MKTARTESGVGCLLPVYAEIPPVSVNANIHIFYAKAAVRVDRHGFWGQEL